MKNRIKQIAIDGPVGAGKSTVARALAERLNILYVDTGAMYRAAAWLAKISGIDWSEAEKVAQAIDKTKIDMRLPLAGEKDGRLVTVIVNGKDVSWIIRTEEISRGSSIVAGHAAVRKVLVNKQRQLAEKQSVVMEGRDISTVVLTHADLKIFLTASVKKRAQRRYKQLAGRKINTSLKRVFNDLHKRDRADTYRNISPLRQSSDVWYLDTTGMNINQVVKCIEKRFNKLN